MENVQSADLLPALKETSGESWEFGSSDDGSSVVLVRFTDGRSAQMKVMRDLAPASEADVRFIAHARSDTNTLAAVLKGQALITSMDLLALEERLAAASPEPWTAFIEADGGLGGCDVIRVTESDDEPDLYLWLGEDLAPAADFRFVALVRQELPRLVAAVREEMGRPDS